MNINGDLIKDIKKILHIPSKTEEKAEEKKVDSQELTSLPQVFDTIEHTFLLGKEPLSFSFATFLTCLSEETKGELQLSSPVIPDLLSTNLPTAIEHLTQCPILPAFHLSPKETKEELPFLHPLATHLWTKLSEKQKEAIQLPEQYKAYAKKPKQEQWPIYLRLVILQEKPGSGSLRWRFGPFLLLFKKEWENFPGQDRLSYPLKLNEIPKKEKIFVAKGAIDESTVLQAAAMETFYSWEIDGETAKKIDTYLKTMKQKISGQTLSQAFPGWYTHDRGFLLLFFLHLFGRSKDGHVFAKAKEWLLKDYFSEEATAKSPFKAVFPLIGKVSLSNLRVILFFITVFESYRGRGSFNPVTMKFQWKNEGKSAWLSLPYTLPSMLTKLKSWKEKEWQAFAETLETYLETFLPNGEMHPIDWDPKQLDGFLSHKEPLAQAMGNLLFLMSKRKEKESFASVWSCLLTHSKKPNLYRALLKLAPQQAVKGFPESRESLELILYYLNSNNPDKVRLAKMACKSLPKEDLEKLFSQLVANDPNEAFGLSNNNKEQKWDHLHAIRNSAEGKNKTLFPKTLLEGADRIRVLAPSQTEPKNVSLIAWWTRKMFLAGLADEAEKLSILYKDQFSPEEKKLLKRVELEKARGKKLASLTPQTIKEEWFKKEDLLWKKMIITRFLGTLPKEYPTEKEWAVLTEAYSNGFLHFDYLLPVLTHAFRSDPSFPESILVPFLTKMLEESNEQKLVDCFFSSPKGVEVLGKALKSLPETTTKEVVNRVKEPLKQQTDATLLFFCEQLHEKVPDQVRTLFPSLENKGLESVILYAKLFFPNAANEKELVWGAEILLKQEGSIKKKGLANVVTGWCCLLLQPGKKGKVNELRKKYEPILSKEQKNKITLQMIQRMLNNGTKEEISQEAEKWIKEFGAFKKLLSLMDEKTKQTLLVSILQTFSSDSPTREEGLFLTLAYETKAVKESAILDFLTRKPAALSSLPQELVATLIEKLKDQSNLQTLLSKLLAQESCDPLVKTFLKDSLFEKEVLLSSISRKRKFHFAKRVYESTQHQDLPTAMSDFLFLLTDPSFKSVDALKEFFTSNRWSSKSRTHAINAFLLAVTKENGAFQTLPLIKQHSFLQVPYEEPLLNQFDSYFKNEQVTDLKKSFFAVRQGLLRNPALWAPIIEKGGRSEEIWSVFWSQIKKNPSLFKQPSEWTSSFLTLSCQLHWHQWNQVAGLFSNNNQISSSMVETFATLTEKRLKDSQTPNITLAEKEGLAHLSSRQTKQTLLQTTINFLLNHPTISHQTILPSFLKLEKNNDYLVKWIQILNDFQPDKREKILQSCLKDLQEIAFPNQRVSCSAFSQLFPLLSVVQKQLFLSLLTPQTQKDMQKIVLCLFWNAIFEQCTPHLPLFIQATATFLKIYEPFSFDDLPLRWKNHALQALQRIKTYSFKEEELRTLIEAAAKECSTDKGGTLAVAIIFNLYKFAPTMVLSSLGNHLKEILFFIKTNSSISDQLLQERLNAAEALFTITQKYDCLSLDKKREICFFYIDGVCSLLGRFENKEDIIYEKVFDLFFESSVYLRKDEEYKKRLYKLLQKVKPYLSDDTIEGVLFFLMILQDEEKFSDLKKLTKNEKIKLFEKVVDKNRVYIEPGSYFFITEIVRKYAHILYCGDEERKLLFPFFKKSLTSLEKGFLCFQKEEKIKEVVPMNFKESKNSFFVDNVNPSKQFFYEKLKEAVFIEENMKLLTEEEQEELYFIFYEFLVRGYTKYSFPLSYSFGHFSAIHLMEYLKLPGKKPNLEKFLATFFKNFYPQYFTEVANNYLLGQTKNEVVIKQLKDLVINCLQQAKAKISSDAEKECAGVTITTPIQIFLKTFSIQLENVRLPFVFTNHLVDLFEFCLREVAKQKKEKCREEVEILQSLASFIQLIEEKKMVVDHSFANITFDFLVVCLKKEGKSLDLHSFHKKFGDDFFSRLCKERVLMFASLPESSGKTIFLPKLRMSFCDFLSEVKKEEPTAVKLYALSILQGFVATRNFLPPSYKPTVQFSSQLLQEIKLLLKECETHNWLAEDEVKAFKIE